MRAALIVGINYYENTSQLYGCVNDAYELKSILERHDGGAVNFACKLLPCSGPAEAFTRSDLRAEIKKLFNIKAEVVLFYFSGHGFIDPIGGYLTTADVKGEDDGVSMSEILSFANDSPADNKIIILDCCHSGIAGNVNDKSGNAYLSKGITILTASTAEQYASEEDGSGLFTSLLVDALRGSAANLTGDITPGSVYAHIDQSLGPWEQRPTFKTNVESFISLRKSSPAIELEDLRLISKLFPKPGYYFHLDPSYEPNPVGKPEGAAQALEENTKIFGILQKYNRLNLLQPVDAPHMWNAAIECKGCRLTALGEHYRKLSERERI